MRHITYKDTYIIILQYKAISIPHLEYCIQSQRPYRMKDTKKLQRMQRRAIKPIPERKDLSWEQCRIYCDLTTLETMSLSGD